MNSLHIFSASAILNRIEKNKAEKNLYQHINNVLKGSKQGNSKIIAEIIEIIESEAKQTVISLKSIQFNMKEVESKNDGKVLVEDVIIRQSAGGTK